MCTGIINCVNHSENGFLRRYAWFIIESSSFLISVHLSNSAGIISTPTALLGFKAISAMSSSSREKSPVRKLGRGSGKFEIGSRMGRLLLKFELNSELERRLLKCASHFSILSAEEDAVMSPSGRDFLPVIVSISFQAALFW